jgi:two-component system sensor histidine kinase TctE
MMARRSAESRRTSERLPRRKSGTRGSGLGLAIAAEIAAAHGGTAEAARAFPRGLRIRLSLPACYASPRRIRTAAAPSSTSA